jgi:membrane-bound acyltransferase YfiQ involved in biofilm formation
MSSETQMFGITANENLVLALTLVLMYAFSCIKEETPTSFQLLLLVFLCSWTFNDMLLVMQEQDKVKLIEGDLGCDSYSLGTCI